MIAVIITRTSKAFQGECGD